MLHVYKVKVGQLLTGCKMDYVYPSHEGHDPAGVTGLLSPIAHRDHAGINEAVPVVPCWGEMEWAYIQLGSKHNTRSGRNGKDMCEQAAMAQEAWSLQLAVSKLAPQVLSEQGPLPSKKWWLCFPAIPHVSGRIFIRSRKTRHLGRVFLSAKWTKINHAPQWRPMEFHSGSKHDWGQAGTHSVYPRAGWTLHILHWSLRQGQTLTQKSRVGKPPGVVVCWVLWVAVWASRKLAP